jgi:hypothetical protein
MNPCVTFGSCFVDLFWINRAFERFRIHASSLEADSVMISESAATRFSLTISGSTRAGGVDESTHHLQKLFCWLFLCQQRLRALSNSRITFGKCFSDDFPFGTDFFFFQQGLSSLPNPRVTFERCFHDIFQSAPTLFLLTFSELTGAATSSKSTRHL